MPISLRLRVFATFCYFLTILVTFLPNKGHANAKAPHPTLPATPEYVCNSLLLGARHGKPANRLGLNIFRGLLNTRYNTTIHGLDEILTSGEEGMLILPNHSGTVDPLIVLAAISGTTNARPVMTEEMAKGPTGPLLKKLMGGVNAILLPSAKVGGKTGSALAQSVINEIGNSLGHGDNIVLYPSGAIQTSSRESIGNKSAVQQILAANSGTRIVLVRERGIWGSSWTHGDESSDPNQKISTNKLMIRGLWTGFKTLLLNGFVLTPKRPVTLEFFEPKDFPRNGSREEMNTYLENFYNDKNNPERRTFVRRYFWQVWKKRVTVSETDIDYGAHGAAQEISIDLPELNKDVADKILEIGRSIFTHEDLHLGTDLQSEAGLDSLNQVDLLTAISESFDINLPDDAQFANLAELTKLVMQEGEKSDAKAAMEPSPGWKANPTSQKKVSAPSGQTVTEMVIKKALAEPKKVIGEDQMRGPVTYNDLLIKAVATSSVLERLPGDKLGILLPASGGGPLVYTATHLAGKVPVYVNFTAAPDAIVASLNSIGVQRIVTSRKVFETLAKDYDMSRYMERFIFLEDLIRKIKLAAPMALLKVKFARFAPASLLRQARRTKHAVILFTSGSSGTPKAVPLTHENILANVNDLSELFEITESDRVLSFLPPFHSFGHMTQVLSLALGVPAVYHVKPTDAQTLASIIDAYKPTILAGTPSFLEGIGQRARGNNFGSVRLIFAGAEKLKPTQIDLLKQEFPNADILEGYGLTEMSPVVSVNPPGAAKFGTVGKMLQSLQYLIVDAETRQPVLPNQPGILLASGPSVFPGYLNTDGKQPFVEVNGVSYYDTGDVVVEDPDGYIKILGRMGRFRKMKGEMISLPALEDMLSDLIEPSRPTLADGSKFAGPIMAVESAEDNAPFVLFTTVSLDLAEVQRYMRSRGATGAQMIGEVRVVNEIPMLGTGKTDYKVLQSQLKSERPH